jgi:hypothetical protein
MRLGFQRYLGKIVLARSLRLMNTPCGLGNNPKMRILGIVTLAVALACWEIPQSHAATDQDFDLACAVVSAAEIATTRVGSEERNAALQIQFFYLGRLSGRDDQTYWSAVVKGRIAQLKAKAKAPDLYGSCAEFVTKMIE